MPAPISSTCLFSIQLGSSCKKTTIALDDAHILAQKGKGKFGSCNFNFSNIGLTAGASGIHRATSGLNCSSIIGYTILLNN